MSKVFNSDQSIEFYIQFRSSVLPILFLVMFVAVSLCSFWMLWDTRAFTPIEDHITYLKQVVTGEPTLQDYIKILQDKKLYSGIEWRVYLSLFLGLLASFIICLPWRHRPNHLETLQVVEGTEVYKQPRAGLRALKKKMKSWKKKGIQVYKGKGGSLNIPYDIEAKHQIFLGSVGSGKSATMAHAIQSILARKDRAIIYDYKGDMTEWVAGMEGASILGVADSRSKPWYIARDINNSLLARELAQTVIQETSDPNWSNSARDIVAGVIEYLICNKPDVWGFKDIADILNGDRDLLVDKLRSIDHGSLNTIDKPKDDKMVSSVMGVIRSNIWIFDILGKAWGNPSSGFSVKDWLKDESPDNRIIILRNHPEISSVSNVVIYLIFNQMFGEVLSLSDSKERRIWAIIDEWATLPMLPRLEEALVASRSKGFRFCCGIQNFASMREKYGANVAQTLYSQFATKIISRINDAETAEKLAKDLGGQRRVRRADIKLVPSINYEGNNILKWQIDWKESVEPTILDSAIMGLPDPTETSKVYAWFYSAGFPLVRLQWKFLKMKATAERDSPVEWQNEAIEMERSGLLNRGSLMQTLEDSQDPKVKPKPFPKKGKLSQPQPEAKQDAFDNLDDIDDSDFRDGE